MQSGDDQAAAVEGEQRQPRRGNGAAQDGDGPTAEMAEGEGEGGGEEPAPRPKRTRSRRRQAAEARAAKPNGTAEPNSGSDDEASPPSEDVEATVS